GGGQAESWSVTVHVAVAGGHYKTLIDAALFLPQAWDADRDRCRAAGIPDEVVYRPKWQLALRQLTRAGANGIALDWLTFDEGYGDNPGFLSGLDELGGRHVGAVRKSCRCCRAPRATGAKGYRADDLVRHSPAFHGQPGQQFRPARPTPGEQVWQAKAAPVWLSFGGRPGGGGYRLIWARNERTG